MDMLFSLAHWHGLAKLRLHMDAMLYILNEMTDLLGQALRNFQHDTCSAFQTRELKKEADARKQQ